MSMVFWSLSFVWYKDVYLYFQPITTVFFRLVISSVILLIIAAFMKKLAIKRADYKLFLLAALFEPFLYFLGESFGMQLVSSVTAAVIISTVPVFTPIVARLFFNERLSKINIAGILISFIGVGLVIFKRGMQIEASVPGVMLMFLAVISAIGYAVALKKLTPNYEPITIVALQNTIGVFLFAPLFFIYDFNVAFSNITFVSIIPVLKLAIFASSLAFILYAHGVNQIGVSKANIFTNLIPVLTTIFAYYMLDETLSVIKITGILIVVGGVFLSQINRGFAMKVIKIMSFRLLK
jgi:drug/metabolite transporter (DMT)-like permease